MKRLIQRRRAFGVALIVSIVASGLFAIFLARKPIRLVVARFETGAESGAAIIEVMNRSRYCYTFRFKRNEGDVPCVYTQQTATGKTQWVGKATLERAGGSWPRPILAGETIYLRLPLPTNGPVVASFELQPVKTVDDVDSIVWDLRKAGEDFGILSEKLIVRTEPIEAP